MQILIHGKIQSLSRLERKVTWPKPTTMSTQKCSAYTWAIYSVHTLGKFLFLCAKHNDKTRCEQP